MTLRTAPVDKNIVQHPTRPHRRAAHVAHEPSANLQKGVGRLVLVDIVLLNQGADAVIGSKMPCALPIYDPLRRRIPCMVDHSSLFSIMLSDSTATHTEQFPPDLEQPAYCYNTPVLLWTSTMTCVVICPDVHKTSTNRARCH